MWQPPNYISYPSSDKNPCSKAPGNWNVLSFPWKLTTILDPSIPMPKALCFTIVPAWTPLVSIFITGFFWTSAVGVGGTYDGRYVPPVAGLVFPAIGVRFAPIDDCLNIRIKASESLNTHQGIHCLFTCQCIVININKQRTLPAFRKKCRGCYNHSNIQNFYRIHLPHCASIIGQHRQEINKLTNFPPVHNNYTWRRCSYKRPS